MGTAYKAVAVSITACTITPVWLGRTPLSTRAVRCRHLGRRARSAHTVALPRRSLRRGRRSALRRTAEKDQNRVDNIAASVSGGSPDRPPTATAESRWYPAQGHADARERMRAYWIACAATSCPGRRDDNLRRLLDMSTTGFRPDRPKPGAGSDRLANDEKASRNRECRRRGLVWGWTSHNRI